VKACSRSHRRATGRSAGVLGRSMLCSLRAHWPESSARRYYAAGLKWRKAAGVEPTRKRLAPPPGFEAQSHRRVRVPSPGQARRPVGRQCCMACRAPSRRSASQQLRVSGRRPPPALFLGTWVSSPMALHLAAVPPQPARSHPGRPHPGPHAGQRIRSFPCLSRQSYPES